MLHYDVANVSLLDTAQDQLTICRFTLHDPVIPDDTFMSPPRNYDHLASWLYSPNDGTISQSLATPAQLVLFRAATGGPTHPGCHMIQ